MNKVTIAYLKTLDKEIKRLQEAKRKYLKDNCICNSCQEAPASQDKMYKALNICDDCLSFLADGYNGKSGW